MQKQPLLFDHDLVRRRRTRALEALGDDALWQDGLSVLAERLYDVKRAFKRPLVIGPVGALQFSLAAVLEDKGAQAIIYADTTNAASSAEVFSTDLEQTPFGTRKFDLILSVMVLQEVDDIPRFLSLVYESLEEGGLFLGLLPGGETLCELRHALLMAEESLSGQVSPRVIPMLSSRSASDLMQRAGFELPVVDVDHLTLSYDRFDDLLRDLRRMGATNALLARRKAFTPGALFEAAARFYETDFALEDGALPVTLDRLYLHGWRPADSN